jgi:hypothetical protein
MTRWPAPALQLQRAGARGPREGLRRGRTDLPQERIDPGLKARRTNTVCRRVVGDGLPVPQIRMAPATFKFHRTRPSPGPRQRSADLRPSSHDGPRVLMSHDRRNATRGSLPERFWIGCEERRPRRTDRNRRGRARRKRSLHRPPPIVCQGNYGQGLSKKERPGDASSGPSGVTHPRVTPKRRAQRPFAWRFSAVSQKSLGIRPPLHPVWRRCSSLKYAQYSRSSRLASRAHGRPRCSKHF